MRHLDCRINGSGNADKSRGGSQSPQAGQIASIDLSRDEARQLA